MKKLMVVVCLLVVHNALFSASAASSADNGKGKNKAQDKRIVLSAAIEAYKNLKLAQLEPRHMHQEQRDQFYESIAYNQVISVKIALEAGMNPNRCEGDTAPMAPLEWATFNGYEEIVDLLLQKGARADYITEDGSSLPENTVCACKKDKKDRAARLAILRKLFAAGASPNINMGLLTALHAGVEFVQVYIDAEADPNQIFDLGKFKHVPPVQQIFTELQSAGIDVSQPVEWTALLQAVGKDQLDTTRFLLEHGAKVDQKVTWHFAFNEQDHPQGYAKYGSRYTDLVTPLHFAKTDAMKALLAQYGRK